MSSCRATNANRVVVECAADIDSVIGILSERVTACAGAPINSWRGGVG